MVQNKVKAAYARSDLFERRQLLMNDWPAYLGRDLGPVIALRRWQGDAMGDHSTRFTRIG